MSTPMQTKPEPRTAPAPAPPPVVATGGQTGDARIPRSFVDYLRGMGPGIVVALAWLGTGDLINSSVSGANYGYVLMWALVIATLARFFVVSALTKYQLCNRANDQTILDGFARVWKGFPMFLTASRRAGVTATTTASCGARTTAGATGPSTRSRGRAGASIRRWSTSAAASSSRSSAAAPPIASTRAARATAAGRGRRRSGPCCRTTTPPSRPPGWATGGWRWCSTTTAANDDPDVAVWPTRRYPLTIALSEDEGETWPWMRHIDPGDGFFGTANEPGNRVCAYPSVVAGPDGAIHVAYSYGGRQCIKYVRVTEAWIRDEVDYVYGVHVSHAHPF